MKVGFILLCALASTYAATFIENSAVFGEQDFKVATLNVTFCPDGCNLYLSYNKGKYLELAKKIYVQNPRNPAQKWTFAELDGYVDQYDYPRAGKGYLPIGNWPLFKIINENANQRSFPVLVYMATRDAVNLGSAEVYDVRMAKRDLKPASVVTIMNPDEFTLKVSSDGPTKLSVFSRGFDKANMQVADDDCALLYRQTWNTSMPAVSFPINGPLVTLLFERAYSVRTPAYNAQIEWSAAKNTKVDLDQPNFITSQGYLGCTAKEVFQSSDYSSATDFRFTSAKGTAKNVRFGLHFNNQNVAGSGSIDITDVTNKKTEKISKSIDKALAFTKTKEVQFKYTKETKPSTFYVRSYSDKTA